MSILFEKMTPEAREIAEEKLRAEGILAPDAPLEYAFEVLASEMPALEQARADFDDRIAACGAKDHAALAQLAIDKARRVQKGISELA
ncbi:hypothetical protein [Shimia sediminis]|uniref:hypothetical protein n=1 Tax=Shimia sediminis TaxID=2497945 RepID=UPI000F8E099B|nr:hypothetical protein [Shimia sediminis]